jgi:hypothetical protein
MEQSDNQEKLSYLVERTKGPIGLQHCVIRQIFANNINQELHE